MRHCLCQKFANIGILWFRELGERSGKAIRKTVLRSGAMSEYIFIRHLNPAESSETKLLKLSSLKWDFLIKNDFVAGLKMRSLQRLCLCQYSSHPSHMGHISFSTHISGEMYFHPLCTQELTYQTVLVSLPYDVSPFYIDPGSSFLKVLNNWGINRIDNLELIPVSLSTPSSPFASLTSTTTASNHLLFKKYIKYSLHRRVNSCLISILNLFSKMVTRN